MNQNLKKITSIIFLICWFTCIIESKGIKLYPTQIIDLEPTNFTGSKFGLSRYVRFKKLGDDNKDNTTILAKKHSFTQVFADGSQISFKISESTLINILSKNVSSEHSNGLYDNDEDDDDDDDDDDTTTDTIILEERRRLSEKQNEDDANTTVNGIIIEENPRRRLSIEGTDSRTQVLSSYSTSTPYKEMGQVAYYADGQWNYCSGTLIGPRHVLTHASCLHGGSDMYLDGGLVYDGDWYSSIYFCPSRVSSSCSTGWYSMESAYVPNGWIEDSDSNYNYGLLVLSTSPNVGYHQFGYSNSITTSTYFYSIGYPSDKSTGTMWWTSCYMRYVGSNYMIDSSCDFYRGQEGSALYTKLSGSGTRVIYGLSYDDVVVSCGSSEACDDSEFFCFCYDNQHIKFTSLSYEEICSWINDDTVC
jgi:V8-like Glu-specific endopeptidase